MDNVFIVSIEDGAAATAFGAFLEKGCALEEMLPFLGNTQAQAIRRFYPDGPCYLWGVQESADNLSSWELINPDDLVLGYRDRCILFASRVLMKLQNPSLAARLWGHPAGGPFGLMCFSDRPRVGEVPIVPQMYGYLDLDCKGFTRLDPKKRDNILRDYGSLDVFVRLGLRYDFPFNFRHSD